MIVMVIAAVQLHIIIVVFVLEVEQDLFHHMLWMIVVIVMEEIMIWTYVIFARVETLLAPKDL